MAEATLPLPAKVHATVARALDWVWPRGAAWAYADAIAHAPGDPELRFLRGNALGRARRWADAARSLADAATLRPRASSTRGRSWWRSTARGATGSSWTPSAASRSCDRARARCRCSWAPSCAAAGRKAEALRAFRLAVRLETSPRTRRFVLGETLLGSEGWREALASWNEARQIEAASGSVILRNAGRRSALNFHPGQPMDRVPRREVSLPRPGPLARLKEGLACLRARGEALLHGGWRRPWRGDRVQVLRRAWRKAHPGVATSARRRRGEAA